MASEVRFTVDDVSDILDLMDELADGSGWLVLDGAVHEDDMPPAPGILGLFTREGSRGAGALVGAGRAGRAPGRAAQRRHPPRQPGRRRSGRWPTPATPCPRAGTWCRTTRSGGSWPRCRDGSGNAEVLDWLLRAAAILATVPLSGTWRARIWYR